MRVMAKNISLIIAAILIIASTAIAVPKLINYQGSLSDSSGSLNGDVSITFTIYNTPSAGDVLWSETQTVTVTDGVFNVLLGSQDPFPADLFAGDERYLGVQVDTDPEMSPRQRLASVPFALGAPPVCSPGDFVNCYTGPDGTLGVGECKAGERICNTSGTGFFGTCENEVTPLEETCDGLDNDCNPTTADGSEDPSLGIPCDGPDSDLCVEGTTDCTGGALGCSDTTGNSLDYCNGDTNDDCNAGTPDGYDEPTLGDPCDGVADTDLCLEGNIYCSGAGGLACSDTSGNSLDLCNGDTNDDCNAGTPDGYDEPTIGDPCDGLADSDLCQEGNVYCSGVGGLACSDTTGDDLDLCNGDTNDDCNVATPDGADEPTIGDPCDGLADSDLCKEGTIYCSGVGGLACSDSSDDTLEICGDDIDNDCDGQTDEDCYAQPSVAGDLVITEIMIDPNALLDTEGEWFELYNPTGSDLSLLDCVLSDYGTDSHIITSEVLVPALGYGTLAISNTPGFTPDYVYTGFNLGNSGDEIILTCGGVVIDEVQYDAAFDAPGASKALYSDSLDYLSNDTLSNWYESISDYFTGDLGTPGTVNEY